MIGFSYGLITFVSIARFPDAPLMSFSLCYLVVCLSTHVNMLLSFMVLVNRGLLQVKFPEATPDSEALYCLH